MIPAPVLFGLFCFFGGLFLLVGATKGIAFQWDIGNFAAGLGTFSLAAATMISIRENGYLKAKELERVSSIKISEFRTKWIDELREDASVYLCAARDIALRTGVKTFSADNYDYFASEFNRFEKSSYRIRLKLNKEEESHFIIMDKMKRLRKVVLEILSDQKVVKGLSEKTNISDEEDEKLEKTTASLRKNSKMMGEILEELVNGFRVVEKDEWKKVKSEVTKGT